MMDLEVQRAEDEETLRRAQLLLSDFYWTCFRAGIGSRFHSFLEFCGVMSAYLQMAQCVVEDGGQLLGLNVHGGQRPAVPEHKLMYLAEKLNCIFAPFLRGTSEETKEAFLRALIEGT